MEQKCSHCKNDMPTAFYKVGWKGFCSKTCGVKAGYARTLGFLKTRPPRRTIIRPTAPRGTLG